MADKLTEMLDRLVLSNTDSTATLLEVIEVIEEMLTEVRSARSEIERLRKLEFGVVQLVQHYRRQSNSGVHECVVEIERMCAQSTTVDKPSQPIDPNMTLPPFKP